MMRRMAMTERRYVFEAVETLSDALIPFVERRLRDAYDRRWQAAAAERIRALNLDPQGNPVWDLSTLLRAIDLFWMETFSSRLGRAERSSPWSSSLRPVARRQGSMERRGGGGEGSPSPIWLLQGTYGLHATIFRVLASDRMRQSASPTFKLVRLYPSPKILLVGPGLACVLKASVIPMLSR